MECKIGEMFLWEGSSNAAPVPVEAFRGKVGVEDGKKN
jgi:hypothetical protein